MEVRRHGSRSSVPYHIHPVHDHRHTGCSVLCAALYRFITTISTAAHRHTRSRSGSYHNHNHHHQYPFFRLYSHHHHHHRHTRTARRDGTGRRLQWFRVRAAELLTAPAPAAARGGRRRAGRLARPQSAHARIRSRPAGSGR